MSDLLDWADKSGLENIRFRLQNAETLARDAATTLTVLFAGMGAALAYAIKGVAAPQGLDALAVGAMGLAAWLMVLAVVLIVQCILSTDLPTPTNEPKNLYQEDYDLDALREAELRNLQARIEQVTARNHRVAAWLDRVRLAATASPLVFIISAAAFWAVR